MANLDFRLSIEQKRLTKWKHIESFGAECAVWNWPIESLEISHLGKYFRMF